MSTNPRARAWVEASADALRANFARLSEVARPAPLLPMVKADAYGLGVRDVVDRLEPLEPWGFGVATVQEGVRLRELGISRPVVVCSPTPPGAEPIAVEHRLELFVSSVEALGRLSAAARLASTTARVHVDIDTGMGRSGFDWRRAPEWIPAIRAQGTEVACVALTTHLHSADDDPASIEEQLARLDTVIVAADGDWGHGAGGPPLVHVFNSAGAFRLPGRATALVRPGIFLYGGGIGPGQPEPEPVVSVRARVAHIRDAEAGTTLGYGATHVASGPERWATLSIGYGDGLPRALGNRGSAIVGGSKVPIIGRISMDVTVVDISGVSAVREGDVATLLGEERGERISIDEIAGQAGTISYEVLTGLTARLPRIWTDGEG